MNSIRRVHKIAGSNFAQRSCQKGEPHDEASELPSGSPHPKTGKHPINPHQIKELVAVTNYGKASGYWGVLLNQSFGLGATILATVQLGQEVDKSVINASTYLYVCQHNTEDDARYMAKKLGASVDQIPRVPLHFLIWSPSKGAITKGKVKFSAQGKLAFLEDGAKRLSIGSVCGVFSGLAYLN